MENIYRKLIGNSVFANVVLIMVIAIGVIAVTSITRESNPEINVPALTVTVAYPGADPEEVEEGVSQKIEAAVDGIRGVKQFLTTSSEGLSRVEVEVDTAHDINEVKDRVRNAVEAIQTFPVGAEKPQILRQINTEEIEVVVVSGDLPERQLKELGEEVRAELQALPEVSLVMAFNTRDYEIAVEVSEEQLRKHSLTMRDIADAIRRSSFNQSAGTLQLKGEEVRIRAQGKKYTGPEFESVVVKALPDGEVIRLGHIATISDAFEEDETFMTFNGEPGVLLSVQKTVGDDTIEVAEAVGAYVAEKQPTLPAGAHLSESFDSTQFIRSQISLITKNGLIGLLLVLVVLWLFLETRLAFWVAMGIPISLAGGVALLWFTGASLNQISLIGMIVVMGIIVDDAIVVGEAIYVNRRMGKDPTTAAIDGIKEVGLPVLASVSTTITAFLPMAFVSGVFGQFMRQMPMVVIAALVVSLVECLFLLPAHLRHRARVESGESSRRRGLLSIPARAGGALEWFTEYVYGPIVDVAVGYRYVTLCMGVSLIMVTVGIVAGGHIKVIMWPGVQGDFVRSYLEFPPGTPTSTVRDAVARTHRAIERVAETAQTESGEPLLQSVIASAPYNSDTGGRVIVELLPGSRRGIPADEIMLAWRRETGEIPGALTQSFEGERIGAGDGSDVDYWLKGKDFDALRAASADLKAKLRGYDGVYQISDNFRPGKSEINVSLKPAAHNLGLSLEDVSSQLHAGYYGEEALRLQRGREEVYVRVRYPREEREQISDFERIQIETPQGVKVPLLTVATIDFTQGVSAISSVNGTRGVRVSAAVDRNSANPAEINKDLVENHIEAIVARHPGVSWSLSGQEANNREVTDSLRRNSLLSMLGIFVILCTVFRSYLQPLIIMVIIPYGLVGAIFAHMLIGLPLSFLSMGGIVALAGVLVNDSIVLIERVNTHLAQGLSLHQAVCRGGQRRFRAIFLTSVSTCVGLAPLIVETDLMAQLVIPMAVSVAGGVAFGTMLTLVLIPAFLVIMNDFRRLARRVITGSWPTPEEVEPATRRGVPEPEPIALEPATT